MVDSTNLAMGKTVYIKQFVQDVLGFSSQYGSDVSISYTAYNITGKPSKFPEYGDFPQAFVMRTYGKWWQEAPSRSLPYMAQSIITVDSQDYIDLSFEQPVYPAKIKIFETYNPGSVIRIWAAREKKSWKLLWEGEPQNVGHVPRIFSPVLRKIKFKTRLIRLEFHHTHLEYYTELDAVLLVGTLRPVNNSVVKYDRAIGKLTSQIMELNIHNIPPQVDISNTISHFLWEEFPQYLSKTKESEDTSLENIPSDSGRNYFYCLPDETVLKILGYLDLLSLCRCAQVSKHFYELATDGMLYTELNFKIYWYCTTDTTLKSMAARCQFLQKLDLSWCGELHTIEPTDFTMFIVICGKQLTNLRLNSCKFIDNSCLDMIASVCINLQELCLRNCLSVDSLGFCHLGRISCLEYLDLYRTHIDLATLTFILKSLPHLKHVNIGSCVNILNMDDIALTLATYNRELISVDFWKTYSLTPLGVKALAQCSKLEEIDLGWCLGFNAPSDSLHAIATGCPRLKKLFLAAVRGVTDRDLEPFLDMCPDLEQVDLLGVRSITQDICYNILTNCKKLQLFDISFCDQIQESEVMYWRQLFPQVCIKRSFQSVLPSPDNHF